MSREQLLTALNQVDLLLEQGEHQQVYSLLEDYVRQVIREKGEKESEEATLQGEDRKSVV